MLTENPHAGEFLLSEAAGHYSRENVIIGFAQTLLAGTVLGAAGSGTQTVGVAAYSGNVGNGSIGAPTADAAVPPGVYKVTLFAAGATAAFTVYKPDGTVDGHGAVGSAYNGSVNFTLADGGTDFVAGDGFNITVSYAATRYYMHDPEGTDGRQYAAGVLFDAVTTAADETAKAVAIVRNAEIIAARLRWDDHTTDEKTAALAQLAAFTGDRGGLIAR